MELINTAYRWKISCNKVWWASKIHITAALHECHRMNLDVNGIRACVLLSTDSIYAIVLSRTLSECSWMRFIYYRPVTCIFIISTVSCFSRWSISISLDSIFATYSLSLSFSAEIRDLSCCYNKMSIDYRQYRNQSNKLFARYWCNVHILRCMDD